MQSKELKKNLLLNCPFCGNEAELKTDYHDDLGIRYWVSCKECGSRQAHSSSKESVIKAWNTRKSIEKIGEPLEIELRRVQKVIKQQDNSLPLKSYCAGLSFALNFIQIYGKE